MKINKGKPSLAVKVRGTPWRSQQGLGIPVVPGKYFVNLSTRSLLFWILGTRQQWQQNVTSLYTTGTKKWAPEHQRGHFYLLILQKQPNTFLSNFGEKKISPLVKLKMTEFRRWRALRTALWVTAGCGWTVCFVLFLPVQPNVGHKESSRGSWCDLRNI